MADISAFPTIHDVLYAGDNLQNFTAGEALTAGQVVGMAATGVSMTVVAMDATSGEYPIGVVLYDVSSGGLAAVACVGTIVYVANADDTTGIDARDWVQTNDNSVKGTVSAVPVTATGGATVTCHYDVVGYALDDIAGGGTGRIMIQPCSIVQANSS